MSTISTPWTEPVDLALGVEADAAQYNDEVVSNLRNLNERNEARGLVDSQDYTTSATPLTGDGFTDFALYPVVSSDRAYRIHLKAPASLSAAGTWCLNVRLNSNTDIGRIGWVRNAPRSQFVQGVLLWLPESSGAVGLSVYADEVSGTGDLTLAASADAMRSFWIVDIGARPA